MATEVSGISVRKNVDGDIWFDIKNGMNTGQDGNTSNSNV